MWNFLPKMGSLNSKLSVPPKGGCQTAPFHTILHNVPLGSFLEHKQFPCFNRSNATVLNSQNYNSSTHVEPPPHVNSGPVLKPAKCNTISNSQLCNSHKKKKKRRNRRRKKNKMNQPQGPAPPIRQRQLSTTESEDSFVVLFDETNHERISEVSENETETEDFSSCDSIIPHKKVRFPEHNSLCEFHPMVMWAYAYQAARRGPWEQYARDRERFRLRILRTEDAIGHVFTAEHRSRIYEQLFA